VFENHLHFLSFVIPFVLQFLIIIKPWFQSFIILSSPTSIPSLLPPHLPQFFPYFQNRTCNETAIIRMKRVPNKRVVPILLRRCNLSKTDFRLRGSMFLPYLLVRVFKMDDS
jgi:hypothetical protein